jgi:hypothetical protein
MSDPKGINPINVRTVWSSLDIFFSPWTIFAFSKLVIPERLAMVFIIIDNPRRYTTTHMFLCAVVLSAPYSRVIEFILRALTCFFAVGCWLPSSILCKQHSTPLESGPVVKHTIQRQIYKIQKKGGTTDI